jgi:hypothetical protein
MSKPDEPQHRTGPTMTGEGLQVRERETTPPSLKSDWSRDMNIVPKDGMPVWLKGHIKGQSQDATECYWRTTRQFRKGMWQTIQFWSVYGRNPMPIKWEPNAWWREPKDIAHAN